MHCKLCNSTNFEIKYKVKEFNVLKCLLCGTVALDLKSSGKEASQVYSSEYFEGREEYFFKNSIVSPDDGVENQNITDFKKGLDLIESYRSPGRLLDIGCATGVFLALAKKRGWDVVGVDVSEFAAKFVSEKFGFKCYAGSIKDADFPDASLDVITLWDVIEHFEDPLEELKEIRRILADDGILLFDTPNEESFMRLMAHVCYKSTAGKFQYPVKKLYHEFHLFYYSQQTLNLLFNKAGFQIVEFRKKTIPVVKARGNKIEKLLVRGLTFLEQITHREFEILAVAKKI